MDILDIIHSALNMAAPITLAALGGLFAYRAGILNISLEGAMLISAFFAVLVSFYTGNVWLAVFTSLVSAFLVSVVFSFFSLKLKSHIIIVGLAINLFALGITGFLLQSIFGVRGSFSSPDIVGINRIHFEWMENIPIVNDLLNNHTPIVYLSLLAPIILTFVLYKTKFGHYVRVVGESEESAEAVGINTNKIKFHAVFISMALSALAGVSLSLENLNLFVEDMTSGRGFIALAAIFCGRGIPWIVFIFSTLFGVADAIQLRLQSFDIPSSFVQMTPYLFIVVVLLIVAIYQNKKDSGWRYKIE